MMPRALELIIFGAVAGASILQEYRAMRRERRRTESGRK